MIVYIESNFVLQLATRQEEEASAEAILDLAKRGEIELAFPTLAMLEPFSTIAYRETERRSLYNSLVYQLAQLQRSTLHQQAVTALRSLLATWTEIHKSELDLLQSTVQQLLEIGTPIEITADTFRGAQTYQGLYDLSPQDSIIYAAVTADLKRRIDEEAKCFVSSNSKDFGDSAIKSELQTYNCGYISKLADALGFIQADTAR